MDYPQRACEHIRYLSVTIGGRGSCTSNQRRAAEYVREQLREVGAADVDFEPFKGAPSTYLPFTLAFTCALAGTLLALLVGTRVTLTIGALLNLLGVWAMFAESEFATNWTRWLLPTANTQNVTGVIPSQGTPERQVVLCAHLDTHRTPIFYSSTIWQKVFGLFVTGAFLSMALGTLAFGLGGLVGWSWLHWTGLLFASVQIFALALVISAEFTPFSPGANDNASGVGVLLSLAERLRQEPLAHTAVNFVFTDCEETGAYGSLAYLDQHAEKLGKDAVYIILDEVGSGHLKTVTADGLILKHKTHPRAVQLSREAASGLVHSAIEAPGEAYTDALPITKRGLVAIAVAAAFPDPGMASSHWHQMSDRIEFIDLQALQDAHTFTWNVLQAVDTQ
jgi:acetylornithine deacetylase/succinyl-diaminopimelate desuccinylase-like protein